MTMENPPPGSMAEGQAVSLKLLVVLAKAYKSVMDRTARDARKHGLALSEFGIMEVLYSKGQLPVQQIAEKILITSGTMTYNVDKLERKGYVRRIPCSRDRRTTYIALTEEGQALFGRIFPAHAAEVEQMMQGLGLEQQQQLIALLKQLGKGAITDEPHLSSH